jgi:Flp pilus assembly protein TadD
VQALAIFALLLIGPEAKKLFHDGEQALRANELAAAERRFGEFLKLEPNNVAALGNMGVVLSRMGRHQDAVQIYERALKLAPKSPDLHLNLGLAYLKQDDHRQARSAFERAAALRPGHPQTLELLASAHLLTGETDRAVTQLESLPQSSGVLYLLALGYLKQNRRDEARASIDRLFATLDAAQAHLLAGRAYYESTMFDEALAELQKARALGPELPGVWRELGKTQVSLRRSEEAEASLREAMKREPADAEAAYFLGALLVQGGNFQEGAPLLERARATRPSFWGAWYYLGKAAALAGDHAGAVRFLTRASELRDDEPSIIYQLSRSLKASGRDEEAARAMQVYRTLQSKSQSQAEEALVAK